MYVISLNTRSFEMANNILQALYAGRERLCASAFENQITENNIDSKLVGIRGLQGILKVDRAPSGAFSHKGSLTRQARAQIKADVGTDALTRQNGVRTEAILQIRLDGVGERVLCLLLHRYR